MGYSVTDGGGDIVKFKYSRDDFQELAALLKRETGISLGENKSALVYSRLTKRLRGLGLDDFKDYCELVTSDSGFSERRRMVAALTTNVTKFFREPHHFAHLKAEVERRAAYVRAGGRLRVWSAGCSNGQEPFSIAMIIYSVLPEADRLDVKVLATDVDNNMIAAGRLGEYQEDLIEAIPPEFRTRWVTRSHRSKHWVMNKKLSSLITFRELNLIHPWPMKHKFDSIFCRNVSIYFEESLQREIWSKLVSVLGPEGSLYIGHSERICGPAMRFLVNDGVTTYRYVTGERR